MTLSAEELKELLSKDMTKEDFESLVAYLKQLTHELGNGTLTKVKHNNKKCEDMAKRAGELNDILGSE